MDVKLKAKLDEESKDYVAEKEIHDMSSKMSVTDHDHYFTRTHAGEIVCKCGWGLFITREDEIRDGHLYKNNNLIV